MSQYNKCKNNSLYNTHTYTYILKIGIMLLESNIYLINVTRILNFQTKSNENIANIFTQYLFNIL